MEEKLADKIRASIFTVPEGVKRSVGAICKNTPAKKPHVMPGETETSSTHEARSAETPTKATSESNAVTTQLPAQGIWSYWKSDPELIKRTHNVNLTYDQQKQIYELHGSKKDVGHLRDLMLNLRYNEKRYPIVGVCSNLTQDVAMVSGILNGIKKNFKVSYRFAASEALVAPNFRVGIACDNAYMEEALGYLKSAISQYMAKKDFVSDTNDNEFYFSPGFNQIGHKLTDEASSNTLRISFAGSVTMRSLPANDMSEAVYNMKLKYLVRKGTRQLQALCDKHSAAYIINQKDVCENNVKFIIPLHMDHVWACGQNTILSKIVCSEKLVGQGWEMGHSQTLMTYLGASKCLFELTEHTKEGDDTPCLKVIFSGAKDDVRNLEKRLESLSPAVLKYDLDSRTKAALDTQGLLNHVFTSVSKTIGAEDCGDSAGCSTFVMYVLDSSIEKRIIQTINQGRGIIHGGPLKEKPKLEYVSTFRSPSLVNPSKLPFDDYIPVGRLAIRDMEPTSVETKKEFDTTARIEGLKLEEEEEAELKRPFPLSSFSQ